MDGRSRLTKRLCSRVGTMPQLFSLPWHSAHVSRFLTSPDVYICDTCASGSANYPWSLVAKAMPVNSSCFLVMYTALLSCDRMLIAAPPPRTCSIIFTVWPKNDPELPPLNIQSSHANQPTWQDHATASLTLHPWLSRYCTIIIKNKPPPPIAFKKNHRKYVNKIKKLFTTKSHLGQLYSHLTITCETLSYFAFYIFLSIF